MELRNLSLLWVNDTQLPLDSFGIFRVIRRGMLLIDDHPGGAAGWTDSRLNDVPISLAWSRTTVPEAKIHRIHAYPAKFPALIASNALDYAKANGVEVQTVADIFCGSGTVGLEASARGASFWGCDINPVATMIAGVKNSPVDPADFLRKADGAIRRCGRASSRAPVSDAAAGSLSRWYAAEQFAALARLRNAMLEDADGSDEYVALECAFSAIAKPTSQWRARSAKPAFDPGKRAPSVLDAFTRQCTLMASAWSHMSLPRGPRAKIVCGCATDVRGGSPLVDLIVTSPPYATSYEYSDLHQLSALWLGFVDDHRDLRSGAIGTSSRRSNLARAARDLNSVGLQVVFSMFDRDRALAETLATYFLDMQKVARRCYDLLRPGGLAIFVIGDTRLRNIRVANVNHLIESLIDAGFADVRVARRTIANKPNTPYRSREGRLASSPTGHTIYSEEYVLMAHR